MFAFDFGQNILNSILIKIFFILILYKILLARPQLKYLQTFSIEDLLNKKIYIHCT